MAEPIHEDTPTAGSSAFTAGQKIAGGCVLKSILAWGAGPGVTWLASDEAADKDVALHILPGNTLQDADTVAGMRALARKSRAVIHPHLVRIEEFIETPDWAALRMDFVNGETLASLLEKKESGHFKTEEIKPWIFQLCETLRDARRARLPALDLSPANLILAPGGRLVVASFGASGGRKDDVQALGALLHELLSGKPTNATGGAPLPEDWAPVVAACLSENASVRPGGAMDVASRLGLQKEEPSTPSDGARAAAVSQVAAPTVEKLQGAAPNVESTEPGLETREGCRFPGLAIFAVALLVAIVTAALYFANTNVSETFPATPGASPSGASASPMPAPINPGVAKSPVLNPTIVPSTPVPDRQLAKKQAEAALQEALKDVTGKTRLAAAAAQSAAEAATLSNQKQQAREAAAVAAAAAQQTAVEKSRGAQDAAKAAAEAAAEAKNQASTALAAQTHLDDAKKQAAYAQRIAEAAEAAALAVTPVPSPSAKPSASPTGISSVPTVSPEATIRIMRAEPVFPLPPSPTATPKVPAPTPKPSAASPKPSPAASAKPSATLSPNSPGPSPSPNVKQPASANTKTPVEKVFVNSLGMRFTPVGSVLFSVWVTRSQDFAEFAKATGFSSSAWKDPGFEQAPSHPVVYVSWDDAVAFCKWLTQKEQKAGLLTPGQYYRLPTDIEWSRAVGLSDEGGSTPEARDMDVPSVFPWGTTWPPPHNAGNYTGEETSSDVAIKGYNDGYVYTSPVGAFPPNKFGLYDMGGNVSQWCADSWNSEQRAKVLRGGSWYNGALRLSLLSSCRVHAPPETSTDNWGFRCVIANDGSGSSKR